MTIDIDKLTQKQLIDLNHKVVQRLKFLESMRNQTEMLEFSVGEKVSVNQSKPKRKKTDNIIELYPSR